jgi:ribosomal protein S18 acetylase RimI-like enzyme
LSPDFWHTVTQVEFVPVDANLRASFRILAAGRPCGQVREFPGVSIAHAGVTFQMFNAAFLSAPVGDETELARHISQAAVFFQARGTPWSFWVTQGWMVEPLRRRSRSVFQRHGLRHVSEMPGMVADTLPPVGRSLPPLDVQRVSAEPSRRAFCELGSSCFNVPRTWFNEVFDTKPVWEHFRGYVGFVNGEPIATAAVVAASDVLGVYNVAILPGWQRRGYGEAIMRAALDDTRLQHPIDRTILQSTMQGLGLYLRLGYRTVTKIDVYAS